MHIRFSEMSESERLESLTFTDKKLCEILSEMATPPAPADPKGKYLPNEEDILHPAFSEFSFIPTKPSSELQSTKTYLDIKYQEIYRSKYSNSLEIVGEREAYEARARLYQYTLLWTNKDKFDSISFSPKLASNLPLLFASLSRSTKGRCLEAPCKIKTTGHNSGELPVLHPKWFKPEERFTLGFFLAAIIERILNFRLNYIYIYI